MVKQIARLIEIVEVGPRDGLQNEPDVMPTPVKVELINRLVAAGVRRIEAASFVHPKKVPQMADAEAVMAALPRRDDVCYIGLVLNYKGYERAVAAHCNEIGMALATSNTFNQRNQGTGTDGSIAEWLRIAKAAHAEKRRVQVTLSTCFGCPFEGDVPFERVVDIVKRVAEGNPREIALADTIGAGAPAQVTELVQRVREAVPGMPLRCHFHNTRNTGIANAYAAVEAGVEVLDASAGGIGGCPFAPAATGNIPTEDLLYMLHRSGVRTGLNLDAMIDTGRWLQQQLGRTIPGMLIKAGNFPSESTRPS
jgi:hydroxymethylglutaryl-CoA lyase